MSETFGQRLTAIRITKRINDKAVSQEKAAQLIGCSLAAYRSWEKDRRLPSAIFRKFLCELWSEVFE